MTGATQRGRYVLGAVCAAAILGTSFVTFGNHTRAVVADTGVCPLTGTLQIGPLGAAPNTGMVVSGTPFSITGQAAQCTSAENSSISLWAARGLAEVPTCEALPDMHGSADVTIGGHDYAATVVSVEGSLLVSQWQFQSTGADFEGSGVMTGPTDIVQQCLAGATTFTLTGKMQFVMETVLPI